MLKGWLSYASPATRPLILQDHVHDDFDTSAVCLRLPQVLTGFPPCDLPSMTGDRAAEGEYHAEADSEDALGSYLNPLPS